MTISIDRVSRGKVKTSPMPASVASVVACVSAVVVVSFAATGLDAVFRRVAASGGESSVFAVVAHLREHHVALLRAALRPIVPLAKFSVSVFQDPEEGWTRDFLTVRLHDAEVASLSEIEDRFYRAVDADTALAEALRAVTVEFA